MGRWITFPDIRDAVSNTYRDISNNHLLALAAGLSYYFFLSLFPALIFLAALLGYIPIPNLFDQLLSLMSKIVPPDAMGAVREVLKGVLSPPKSGLLSFGLITTIWASSGGFASLIESLNVAYDVAETRSYIRTRLLAVGLTFLVGGLGSVGILLSLLGPRFGVWINAHSNLDAIWLIVWPYLYWGCILLVVILAVELLYFLAPNVKQKFWATLPGAVIAVAVWIGASHILGIYFRNFAHYTKTYGAMGGIVALMLWFYATATSVLVGGELNSELLKVAGKALKVKEPTPQIKRQGDLCPEEKQVLVEKLVTDQQRKLERKPSTDKRVA